MRTNISRRMFLGTGAVAAAGLAMGLAGCGGSNGGSSNGSSEGGDYAALDPVVLIGADSTSQGSAGQQFGEYVAKRVDEITGGQLTVDYHPNSDLGGDTDLLRQMQSGDIDMVVCQTAPMTSFIAEMAVFDLPMAFSTYTGDQIESVLNGENDFTAALDAAYEANGLHRLGFLQNGTYRLTTSNSELNTLADFKGLQIRTMENKNHMDFWSAIGAEPTPLAFPELYLALQNGTIDAEENAADTCVGASFNEVQKYLACTNHILYCNQICMNEGKFEGLDPLYQDAIKQAVAEAIEYMRPQLAQIDTDSKQTLVDGGMTIIEYDEAFFTEITSLDAVQKLYKSIDEEQINGLGTALVAALEAAK